MVSAWKCDECNEIFYMVARISTEIKLSPYQVQAGESSRTIVEKPCCPYCKSIRFHPVEVEAKP